MAARNCCLAAAVFSGGSFGFFVDDFFLPAFLLSFPLGFPLGLPLFGVDAGVT